MKDPFPIGPPAFLVQAVKPFADRLSLSTIPLHAHEVFFATLFYFVVSEVFSPWISRLLVPARYNAMNRRNRTNWDVHVTSFIQSVVISTISLYIIFYDEERKTWRASGAWEDRIWAYSGSTGLCQAFALGYFLWDLWMCTYHVEIFGWGMTAHAISAVSVFSFGFRPFVNFYCPVFLLYELSSPFLNIHWFCDKVGLTGSIYQAMNGVLLTATFFGCRILWGFYSSFRVFNDMYSAIRAGHAAADIFDDGDAAVRNSRSGDMGIYDDVAGQRTAFMGAENLPLWLAGTYLASNLVLNSLNVFWFGKMIETIRSRFEPPFGTKGVKPGPKHWEPEEKANKKAAKTTVPIKDTTGDAHPPIVQRGIDEDGTKSFEVTGSTRRSARSRRKA